jgi:hypothetical protein
LINSQGFIQVSLNNKAPHDIYAHLHDQVPVSVKNILFKIKDMSIKSTFCDWNLTKTIGKPENNKPKPTLWDFWQNCLWLRAMNVHPLKLGLSAVITYHLFWSVHELLVEIQCSLGFCIIHKRSVYKKEQLFGHENVWTWLLQFK